MGHVDWLRDRLNARPWSLLACCGSEPRSIALANYLDRNRLRDVEIVAIHDLEPLDPAAHKERLLLNHDSLEGHGYQPDEIRDVELLADLLIYEALLID